MKRLVTGIRDGKSCVVQEDTLHPQGQELIHNPFYSVEVNPAPMRPAGVGDFLDVGVPAGSLAAVTVFFPPNAGWPRMHHTDSFDLHTVISGSVDLILDDGAHTLSAGDCAVVAGVDHAWKSGPEGCTTSIVIVGAPPRGPSS
jgi:quercetin dioxygenase-like cupin family protein